MSASTEHEEGGHESDGQTDKRKQDKLKFDRVINLARRLPQPAIHDLLRMILPIQADYLLGSSQNSENKAR